ncbi:hypothetical protein KAJ61_02855 [Candidatus Parcubacteria bacterium]|nr:hypothetical protein [Candidatus Parcubacteria bacterium]
MIISPDFCACGSRRELKVELFGGNYRFKDPKKRDKYFLLSCGSCGQFWEKSNEGALMRAVSKDEVEKTKPDKLGFTI